ncbi:toxin-antitoxin system YwqK family antitoxin [Rasiella sp. SM2506]|uniref:toxin-antitoxin system YwqK family antitoxin n=1 Tax=Rasiella sp. SM2506 TaxID=3423914 RepID=UPI003D7A251D
MPLKKQFLFFYLGIICSPILFAANPFPEKNYQKEYYNNGTLKAEGWELGATKTDYWYFYYPNGEVASKGSFSNNKREGYWYFYDDNTTLLKQGHYQNGIAEDWWIFYDIATQTEKRFQFKNDKKNGFAFIYKKGRLKRAEAYKNNQKTGEWTSIFAFKKDNPHLTF